MGKKIFITGAAGFIGFHASLALKKAGWTVIGCDNFDPYYSLTLKQARKARLEEAGIPIWSIDLSQKSWEAACSKEQFSHCLHLAARPGVRSSGEENEAAFQSNIVAFFRLLEWLKSEPSCKLVFASSASVYGGSNKLGALGEETAILRATSPYAASKMSNELLAASYSHLFGLSIVGLRFFSVYGPWGRPDMAYYRFAEKILANEPISLFGGGALKRAFTYIDDLIPSIMQALEIDTSFDIFNLGTPLLRSIQEVVEILEKLLQNKAICSLEAAVPLADPVALCPDITKSQEILSFFPTIALEAGLKNFVRWFLAFSEKNRTSLIKERG